jgi:hypothetical protein
MDGKKRRRTRDREAMMNAVKRVRGKEMGLLKASKAHNVPRTTVTNYVNNKKFWKELICLLSLNYLKMSFALKPAFAPA